MTELTQSPLSFGVEAYVTRALEKHRHGLVLELMKSGASEDNANTATAEIVRLCVRFTLERTESHQEEMATKPERTWRQGRASLKVFVSRLAKVEDSLHDLDAAALNEFNIELAGILGREDAEFYAFLRTRMASLVPAAQTALKTVSRRAGARGYEEAHDLLGRLATIWREATGKWPALTENNVSELGLVSPLLTEVRTICAGIELPNVKVLGIWRPQQELTDTVFKRAVKTARLKQS